MDRFAKIRDDNLKEQNRRFNDVVGKYADVAELINGKKQLMSTFNTAILQESSYVKYNSDIKEINKKIRTALVKHSLPADYLDPIYSCEQCEDKGFVYEDGVTCVRCSHCNKGQTCVDTTFDDFDINIFSDEKPEGMKYSPKYIMEHNVIAAKEYCDGFPDNDRKNLLFYGPSGVGKSFLASCMCSHIAKRGYNAIKVNAFALIDDFKNKHVSGIPYPRDYFGCDFLVIDDIGTEPMYNNITVEYLFALINERMENGRPTLYITNQSFDDCARRYDERLASRIFDQLGTIRLMFIGENRRLKK